MEPFRNDTPLSILPHVTTLTSDAGVAGTSDSESTSGASLYSSPALEAYQSAKVRYHVKPVLTGHKKWFNRFVDDGSRLHRHGAKDASSTTEDEQPPAVTEVTVSHGLLEEILPYASDRDFLEDMVDLRGNMRVDLLLEDLDSFAAAVGYRHCDSDPTSEKTPDVTIVTASVSGLKYQLRPTAIQDVVLRGFVSYVGRSSFEVTVRLCTLNGAEVFVEGLFQMVALHKKTGKPVTINRLKLETDEERRIFAEGEARVKAAKEARQRSLLASDVPPTPEEALLIHQLHLEVRGYEDVRATTDPALEQFRITGDGLSGRPGDVRYTSETWLDNTTLTQPQDRNVHFRVFGGHLMRLGYELAWSIGTIFSRDTQNFLHSDEIVFKRPVDIGKLLVLGGQVTYVSPTRRSFVVYVVADVINPKSGERFNSNNFHFIFYSRPKKDSEGNLRPVLPRLLPKTYEEMMLYLDAKRRWEAAKQTAEKSGIDDMARW